MTAKKILTPLKSIRSQCLWCCDGQPSEVRNCPKTDCHFFKFRMGKKSEKGSLIKIIRKKCFDCGEGTVQAIAKCEFPYCPLFPYRLGKSPAHKSIWANKPNRSNLFKNKGLIARGTAHMTLKTSKASLEK